MQARLPPGTYFLQYKPFWNDYDSTCSEIAETLQFDFMDVS